MIPVKLRLSNFTSYSQNPPELDFSQFKLAAISGLNGAGKSSLLDAVTWSVWGTSRIGDSADDLIHAGALQMEVEFAFELDGHEYSIKRRRSKKGGGSTSLELWSGSHNLTEGTIKLTQQKIIDLLHLSYETFTNSAFLRQGHADEFTTKGPTDRKRILADILGLDHYDKLEEKAKEKAREAETNLQLLEYQLIEIEAELSQKGEREKELTEAEKEARLTEAEIKEVDQAIKEITSQANLLSTKVKLSEQKHLQIEQAQKELADISLQISLKNKAKQEYQVILDQKETILQNYQKLKKLGEDKKALDLKRSELIRVKDELVALQNTINDREDKRKQAISAVEIEKKELQTKIASLTKQNLQLKSAKLTCPTCGQPIGQEKNRAILNKNLQEIEKYQQEIELLDSKIQKYKQVVLPESKQAQEKDQEVKQLEEETKYYPQLTSEIYALEKYLELYNKLQQAETAVKTHTEAILDLQKLENSRHKQILEINKELEALSGYEQQFLEIKQQLETKEAIKQELALKASQSHSRVGQAKQLVSRTQQLERLNLQKQELKSKLTEQKQTFEELSLAFGKRGIQAMIIEQAIPEIEDEANRLLDKLTEGRMKVHFETQRETKTKVQTAEGKMHTTIETLDIIISDEMGERPYELYSGGEAFRVNFSIRLAISKLLTHRAGAKLQFLVIDEGFGSQDAPGRARLVEVIDAIKDDFEKILIITHLEELKEEFPVRIEVTKNAGGSTFELVGV